MGHRVINIDVQALATPFLGNNTSPWVRRLSASALRTAMSSASLAAIIARSFKKT